MKRNTLEQEVIQKYFDYDPTTGHLINKIDRVLNKTGSRAGYCYKNGYRTIFLNNKTYSEHVLIWILHYGSIHDDWNIDHINGIKNDNRLFNLRLVPHRYNLQNQKMSNKKSYSMIPGVIYEKRINRFRVRLMVDGIYKSFGTYADVKDAEKMCIDMRRLYYPGNTL